jgi:adenine/guanine phosphoribosyltransferase-like PRPP-binding protein
MTDHQLLSGFVTHLRAALPDDNRIQELLVGLSDELYTDVAQSLTEQYLAEEQRIKGLNVVLALPDGLPLARSLAELLRLPLVAVTGVSGHWNIGTMPSGASLAGLQGLLVSRELAGGVTEMELDVLAQQQGCEIRALACVLERSSAQGRHRLLKVGMQTYAAVRVAETPSGWIIERRSLNSQRLLSQRR